MKKIFVSTIVLFSALGLFAQTMNDALTFSEQNYYGTARSMALGNAMTAVGGDLGSIGINPAGSAVSYYSQFTITPGFSLSSNLSNYSQSNFTELGNGIYNTKADNFTAANKELYGKMTMPNVGVSFNYETGNRYGVKSVSFAFLSNNTNSYMSRSAVAGVNESTSMLGYFASAATFNCDGMGSIARPSTLPSDVFSRYNDPYDYFNKDAVAAYDSYMINPDGNGGYIAATQSERSGSSALNYLNSGKLKQASVVQKNGTKNDIIFNFGLNYEDRLFFGFNLGIPVMRYSNTEYIQEIAQDEEQFPVTVVDDDSTVHIYNFQNASYTYDYSATGEGVYAKIGIIYLPTDNLRLGASFQTPTSYFIKESWTIAASSMLSGYSHNASNVPVWNNEYNFRAPGIIDLGAAYTFLDRGFVSVDYEFADYGAMKFTDAYQEYGAYYDSFSEVNRLNKLFCGASHALRIGGEFRILPELSIRAGYNVKTSPLKYYTDSEGDLVDAEFYDNSFNYYEAGKAYLSNKSTFHLPVKSYSLGAGWSSAGSFFVDAAVKLTRYPVSYYSPYPEYQSFDGGKIFTASPLIQSVRKLWDFAVTFGWRF